MQVHLKKRAAQSKVVAMVGSNQSRLFYIWSRNTRFLIDTGSELSVLPATRFDRQKPRDNICLTAANGSRINTYGLRRIMLDFGGENRYTFTFTVADVTKAIIGADFLRANSLLVDVANQRLIHSQHLTSTKLHSIICEVPHLNAIEAGTDCYAKLLCLFPNITTPSFDTISTKHGVEHYIPTGDSPPIHSRARHLDPKKLQIAKSEFRTMEDLGIIRRSSSQWASPLHMVKKSNGGWRPCGDYRRLNNATIADKYPLPHIVDFTSNLAGKRIYSKVDLVRGYNHIPVREEDIAKTAIITPFGLWEFLRLPFGLKNAAQAFQRFMDTVLRDLEFVYVYLDDIMVASNSKKEHLEHLRLLFQRLNDNGLTINLAKCEFGKAEIDFLGHHVNREGAIPLKSKVEAIANFPRPNKLEGLQKFVGMINFYHRFLPRASEILKPLFKMIADKNKEKTSRKVLQWRADAIEAFDESKRALANATLLVHPVIDAPLALITDASELAVGATLEQYVDGVWQPLAFFSRQLRPPETKYAPYDLELLAIYLAVKHFRFSLEGRNFTIYTDHKPLTFAFAKATDPWSARQQRHITFISAYTTDVRHIGGKNNKAADALSRYAFSSSAIENGVDFTAMAQAQNAENTKNTHDTASTKLTLEQVSFGQHDSLLCDVSTGQPRPVVPEAFRRKVFDAIHNLSHPSIRTTQKLITQRFVWTGINKQVGIWAKQCLQCQASKVHRHTNAPLQTFDVPQRRFDHINIDLVGPLPASNGFKYLLTIVDRYTRWPEAIPITDATTETCARAFIFSWVSRFGVPTDITSDRGSNFTSSLWSAIINRGLGANLHHTTAYHPQANGLVERFHRHLKTALKARLTGSNWIDELPWVLLGIRTVPKEDLGHSSAELVYGCPLTIPGDFINDSQHQQTFTQLQEKIHKFMPIPTSRHGTNKVSYLPKHLSTCRYVFIRRDAHKTPLQRPYEGPYAVLEHGDKTMLVDIGGSPHLITIDRIKPAHVSTESDVEVAMPPKRGRPKKLGEV